MLLARFRAEDDDVLAVSKDMLFIDGPYETIYWLSKFLFLVSDLCIEVRCPLMRVSVFASWHNVGAYNNSSDGSGEFYMHVSSWCIESDLSKVMYGPMSFVLAYMSGRMLSDSLDAGLIWSVAQTEKVFAALLFILLMEGDDSPKHCLSYRRIGTGGLLVFPHTCALGC